MHQDYILSNITVLGVRGHLLAWSLNAFGHLGPSRPGHPFSLVSKMTSDLRSNYVPFSTQVFYSYLPILLRFVEQRLLLRRYFKCPTMPAEEDSKTFAAIPLERRKRTIRDIACSFDKEILPSEYRHAEYERITDNQARRDPREWTIQGDLVATLMQWGVHDLTGWKFANQLNTPLDRARLFREKLKRRFNEQFAKYDGIARLEEFTRDRRPAAASQIRAQVLDVCNQLHHLVQAAAVDLQRRPEGRLGTTLTLLEALLNVCRRDTDLFFEWQSSLTASVGTEEETSLFYILVNDSQLPNTSDFMLDALDIINANWPWILQDGSVRGQVIQINGVLMGKGARPSYRVRFQTALLLNQGPSSHPRYVA